MGSGIFASALNQQQSVVPADASNKKASGLKQPDRAERERPPKSQARDYAAASLDALVERPLPKSVTMPSFADALGAGRGAATAVRRPEPAAASTASAVSRPAESERSTTLKTGAGASGTSRQLPAAASTQQQMGKGSTQVAQSLGPSAATAQKASSTAIKTISKPANHFDEEGEQQNYPTDKNPFA